MFQKYARMVLNTGLNLQAGQCLAIRCEPVHWELAGVIEAEAYRLGAKLVDTEYSHPQSSVSRSLYQHEQHLGFVPEFQSAKVREMIGDKWSFLRLDGMADPDLAKQIDQKRNAVTVKAQRTVTKPLSLAMLDGTCSWCISPAATDGWARQMGLSGKDALWEELIPILRLDHDKPETAWQKHSATLASRCETLNSFAIDYLRFTGPGTELKIHINPHAQWKGGAFASDAGLQFMPNLPTEEVFTVPDSRKTSGRVAVTRPVNVLGDQVRDAWFEFEAGKVTGYGASYGKKLLDEFFSIDPKARYLGEVALVDASSPIFKSGKVFNSILLDENAACHIALGSGFPSVMKGLEKKSEDELDELGCNKSLLHTDFMIGSDKISVTAHTRSGKEVAVLRDGIFVF